MGFNQGRQHEGHARYRSTNVRKQVGRTPDLSQQIAIIYATWAFIRSARHQHGYRRGIRRTFGAVDENIQNATLRQTLRQTLRKRHCGFKVFKVPERATLKCDFY